jgi:hypothetical protein
MEDKKIILPDPEKQEYGSRLALRLARERLAAIPDIEEQCLKTDARYLPGDKGVAIGYLGQTCIVSLEDGTVAPESGGALPVREQILVLHYFTQARGTPLTGRPVTYQELIDGVNYFPVFTKRAIQPLVAHFGSEPDNLLRIAGTLGGQSVDFGDVAVRVPVFPRVPLIFVLWRGDEEFLPEGSIMFDSTVSDYLTNDDIHTMCETLVWKMVKLLKAGGDYPDKSRD